MGMSKYTKSRLINTISSILFICSGSYLSYNYYQEFPYPQVHWEGIIPILYCLLYFLFIAKT